MRACVRPTGRQFSDARRATVVIIPPSTKPRYKMNNVYTRVYKLHRLSKSGCDIVNLNIRASPSYVSLRIDPCLKKIPHYRCCNKVLDFPCFFLAEPAVRGAPLRFGRQPRAAPTKLPVLLNGNFLVYLLAAPGACLVFVSLTINSKCAWSCIGVSIHVAFENSVLEKKAQAGKSGALVYHPHTRGSLIAH